MKLLFSLTILLSASCNSLARDIVLITYDSKRETVEMVKKIIIEKFEIPKRLIRAKKEKAPCAETQEAIFHFCINKRNELKTLKKNQQFYLKNLKVFRKDRLY